MESRSYYFFFIIFNLSRIVEGGDNSLMNDDIRGLLYKTEGDEVTENYQKKHQNYNACTYNNGKDPNIRKNLEKMIKVLVKDSLPLAMETLDEQEHDIASDIQVAASKIIIQLALHASNITRKILQSMEKPNDSQDAIDTEMQHSSLIDNQNRIKEVQELAQKISLLSKNTTELSNSINVNNKQQRESIAIINNKIIELENLLSKNSTELSNSINVNNKQQRESIAIINNKIIELENLTSSHSHDIRDMLAVIETNQKSLMNFSELLTSQKVKENGTKVASLCEVRVPTSIVPKSDIWKENQIPEKDDLDIYMINQTGCSYLAVEHDKEHALAAGPLPGQLEWRVAVRAREYAAMYLDWDSRDRYSFLVGYYSNTKSGLNDDVHRQYPVRATPGVLAEDRYVPVYIRIKNGKLTAGAECEPEPWFTTDFTRMKGLQIQRVVKSYSDYGAKILYDCPASFTGQ